jgi:hypothetical protein
MEGMMCHGGADNGDIRRTLSHCCNIEAPVGIEKCLVIKLSVTQCQMWSRFKDTVVVWIGFVLVRNGLPHCANKQLYGIFTR